MSSETITLRLQEYWKTEGCLTVPPFAVLSERGLTPALFFGALRKGAWRACQVEEVVGSSSDGGPLLSRHHRRFQVILRGKNGEVQVSYLDSLRKLGIDTNGHDVRFVPEVWDSPCLAVHGCGWQVRMDWSGIGSIVHLHNVGGISPDPLPIRATYDLESLLMFTGEVSQSEDDLASLREGQFDNYVRKQVDAARIDSIFDLIAAECDDAMDNGFFYPAYEHILVCQQLVELLGASRRRLSIDLSGYQARLARRAHRCANAYLEVEHA